MSLKFRSVQLSLSTARYFNALFLSSVWEYHHKSYTVGN